MATYKRLGDMLHGERIVCVYRRAAKPKLHPKTNQHRGKYVTLKGDVKCWIEKEISVLAGKEQDA